MLEVINNFHTAVQQTKTGIDRTKIGTKKLSKTAMKLNGKI